MDHAYYKDRVSAYVDGALPAYEQMAIEEHIARCAECRALLEKLRKLEAMVQESSPLGESDYWEQQAQKIEARLGLAQTEVTRIGPARSWRGLGWKLTAAAASIVVVGVIGFYSLESIRERTDRPPVQMAPSLPPASVVVPEKIQPEPKKAQTPRGSVIIDTQNYKSPAMVQLRKSGGVTEKYQSSGQVSILKAKANSAAAPVEPVPDGQIKIISVPEPVQPTESTPREVARVAPKSVASGAPSDTVMQGAKQKGSPAPSVAERMQSGTVAAAKEGQMRDFRQRESAAAGEVGRTDSLTYWRRIRDSLGDISLHPIYKYRNGTKILVAVPDSLGKRPEKMGVAKLDSAQGKATGLIAKDNEPAKEVLNIIQSQIQSPADSLRLRAVYNIARLSSDSSEVADVQRLLQQTATDRKSPYQKLARAYLDSLGIK